MACFGPKADGPQIFGPDQAGPIYKCRTRPKWADGTLPWATEKLTSIALYITVQYYATNLNTAAH